ncbi:hypothetical protein KIN20_026160 [Parelaphostrongylus tenuis]|uniref:Uncharacterized protein n=1 Tax=Parelaphostrongylus tenuis TaxID=148309 RepID=A0AAD5QXB2_PARTN|nr:hypothetical protein KIN20_026160 [Parelaphostrongylus tenuis]
MVARCLLIQELVPILKNKVFHDRSTQLGLMSSSSEDDCPSDREAMMLHSVDGASADWTMCTRCESFSTSSCASLSCLSPMYSQNGPSLSVGE